MGSNDRQYAPLRLKFWSPGAMVLLVLMAAGAVGVCWRLVSGLGAATNLNDGYPWGIWVAVDVSGGVALAAGGFTTALLVYVFGGRRYKPFLRPALLTAFLGYSFVCLGIMLDLGRYYNIWHPMWPTMWQGRSVLFQIALCEAFCLVVLAGEMAPVFCERFRGRVKLPGALGKFNGAAERLLAVVDIVARRSLLFLIVLGVVLSCLHQAALGTLMVIAPYKMHPLWYSPMLPVLFLLSAFAAGYAMVGFESILASRAFGRRVETVLLEPLSRLVMVFLGLYGVVRISDLVVRDALSAAWSGELEGKWFAVEFGAGVALPFLLLLSGRVRRSSTGVLLVCSLVAAGVLLNRVNVFLVAYRPAYGGERYVPSTWEALVTVGMVAGLVFFYRLAVSTLPVFSTEGADEEGNKALPAAER